MKKNILFCQFSSKLINKDVPAYINDYYNKLYRLKAKDGYYKNEHFFEIPLWIPEICSFITPDKFNRELHIIEDIAVSIRYLNSIIDTIDYIIFSNMEVTTKHIATIIQHVCIRLTTRKTKFIVGGYNVINSINKLDIPKTKFLNDTKTLAKYLSVEYEYKYDYSLFEGQQWMPRLKLSSGCTNKCNFCTVPDEVIELTTIDIVNHIINIRDNLNFKLIYIDDKTFGQASNHTYLTILSECIKETNPDFKGFIIQTTPKQLTDKTFINKLKELDIFAIEIGVESFNDNVLKIYCNKGDRVDIAYAIDYLFMIGIKVIINIIVGLKGETNGTYDNTLSFVSNIGDRLYALNINNIAIYDNTILSTTTQINAACDRSEVNVNKSFHDKYEKVAAKAFSKEIFELANNIIERS